MLTRRKFLETAAQAAAGATVTLLLTPLGCGSNESSGTSVSTNPTNPTEDGCDGAFETSSVELGHTHTLCVAAGDLDAPPAGGATYSTSVTEGHDHSVTMSQAQLATVASGGSVVVTSSLVNGGAGAHTHQFTVQMAPSTTASPPAEPPSTGPY
jgi:hypothetical protein